MPHSKKINGIPLDSFKLAERIRSAMDEHQPKILSRDVAKACGVTPQAVHGWRTNGRIAKRHLLTLADMTGKDSGYFLSGTYAHAGSDKCDSGFQILQRAWDTADKGEKEILIGVAKGILSAQRGKRAGKA
jgi:hypothetical protein